MNQEPTGEIVLYTTPDGITKVEVYFNNEMFWLSQKQIAELFGVTVPTINEHLRSVFDTEELTEDSVIRNFRITASDGKSYDTKHYNLDAILAVGYRVRSARGVQFRQWATERLNEYLTKGFTMDDAKLKELGGGQYWRELLQRIRDIRSSEKVLYRQVLDLYATSIDYDFKAIETGEFFKIVQNKLHYAAHGHTAAEVISTRADSSKLNMGLTSFSGEHPRKSDVSIAKNYLDQTELMKLNTLVSAYFDAAEFRAQSHQSTYMKDWLAHLDRMIAAMDAPVLTGAGSMGHKTAVTKAETEYAKYRKQLDELPSEVERAFLDSIKKQQKKLDGE